MYHIIHTIPITIQNIQGFIRVFLHDDTLHLVGRICNNFEKNRAFYDKSMTLGTWLVDNKAK